MMNFSWGGMFVGGLIMILIWIAVIGLTVWAVSRLFRSGPGGGGGGEPSALDIAKRRYAKGEITKEQYEQFKKDLS